MSSRSYSLPVIALAVIAGGTALLGIRDLVASRTPVIAADQVTANGFTLTSAAVELPSDDLTLPCGSHVELVEANCTACHSPAMIVGQPKLSAEQWRAIMEKMERVYRAGIDPADRPAIVAYLTGLSAAK